MRPKPLMPTRMAIPSLLWLPPVAKCRRPAEGHKTNNACAAVAERGGARVQGRGGRHDVVDERRRARRAALARRRRRAKRARNVAERSPGVNRVCVSVWRVRASTSSETGNRPARARARARAARSGCSRARVVGVRDERHRHERGALRRPRRAAKRARAMRARHLVGDALPPVVLERVDDRGPTVPPGTQHDVVRRARTAASSSHQRQCSRPCGRMAAALAARRGEPWAAAPSSGRRSVALFAAIERTFADHADARQQQVESRRRIAARAAPSAPRSRPRRCATAVPHRGPVGRRRRTSARTRARPAPRASRRPSAARSPRRRAPRTNARLAGAIDEIDDAASRGQQRDVDRERVVVAHADRRGIDDKRRAAITPTSSTRVARRTGIVRRASCAARSGVRL